MSGPCPDCFSGTLHEGTPTGAETTIHGLPVYVAEPQEGVKPKGIVVIIADAFGWDFVNGRVLADRFAKHGGFLVYLPDFMNGSSMDPASMPLMDKIIKPASWFTTIFLKPFYILKAIAGAIPFFYRTRDAVCRPLVYNFFKALRTTPPPFPTNNLKIGAAGFCWGGYYTVQLSHDTPSSRVHRNEVGGASQALQPLIDCGFTAHPSFITVPKDIEPVNLPLSVAVGNEDMAMKGPLIVQMKEILEKKKAGDHEVVIMPGARHGFAVRTDPKDEMQMSCAQRAEDQAIAWFTRWFA